LGAAAGREEDEMEKKTKSYMRTQIRSLRTDRTRWDSVRSQSSKLLE
jgi:hypothetical protein